VEGGDCAVHTTSQNIFKLTWVKCNLFELWRHKEKSKRTSQHVPSLSCYKENVTTISLTTRRRRVQENQLRHSSQQRMSPYQRIQQRTKYAWAKHSSKREVNRNFTGYREQSAVPTSWRITGPVLETVHVLPVTKLSTISRKTRRRGVYITMKMSTVKELLLIISVRWKEWIVQIHTTAQAIFKLTWVKCFPFA